MNKKVYGLLLVSASLFSAGALESCKDTNEDLYEEVRITQNAQYQDLLKRIQELSSRIVNCDCGELKSAVENLQKEIKDLASKDELANLATQKELQDLEKRVKELESQYAALQKQVTGLTVKAVYTPAFGSLNTCIGINSSLLVSYFGNASTEFEIGGEKFSGSLVCDEEDAAGKIYLTVDPANVPFAGKDVELVNSKGEKVGVTLSPLAVSDEVLTFGMTRASEDTVALTYLYETSAKVEDLSKIEHISFDVDAAKSVLKNLANGFKEGFKLTEIADLVKSTINQNVPMSSVKITNEDDYETRVVLSSGLNVGAAAVKPLNLETYKAAANYFVDNTADLAIKVGETYAEIDGVPSPAKVQKAIEKIVEKALPYGNRIKTLAKPVLFVVDGGTVRLVSQNPNKPTVLDNKNVTLVASSYSLELLVPFFKKCVTAEGATVANNGKAVNGCKMTSSMTVNGDATIELVVADYAGNKDAFTGYVTVK